MQLFKRTRKKSAKRVAHAQVQRGFQAAQVDRLLAGWRFDGGFTPAEVRAHLSVIRGRSRELAKDSPHYKKWLSQCTTNIVGEGFALKSKPHDGVPGSSQFKLDEQAARFIEYHWNRFCTYRDPVTKQTWCDATGRKTDAEIDRLNVKTWKRDGEYFIWTVRTSANPYGITWRVLRPDWCDHNYNVKKTANGNEVQCGVEMDPASRRPVAYYFLTTKEDAHVTSTAGLPLRRIPATEIIHGYTQEDEDQPRGIPGAHAIMAKLKMVEELDKAELTAARDEACSVRTYYAPKGAEEEILDLTDPDNSSVVGALTAEKEAGQSEVLPLGWKQEVHTPQHPNKEHAPFKAGILKDIASGVSLEYANFANDWSSVSFSSVRLGTISERDAWKVDQADMVSQCKSPQFLAWLQSFLSLAISGEYPAEKFEKFAEHEYRGRRWMWVDPMKDMAAAVVAADHGWRTNTQITSDLGGDFDDNVDEIKREAGITEGTPLANNGDPAERAARVVEGVAKTETSNAQAQ